MNRPKTAQSLEQDSAHIHGSAADMQSMLLLDDEDHDQEWEEAAIASHILESSVLCVQRFTAAVIVDLLARPGALPDNVVAACLRLLADAVVLRLIYGDGAGITARWRRMLTIGPRDAEFAAEVIATWVQVRDLSSSIASAARSMDLARSIWKERAGV